jgi:hypothetical protein
MWHSRVVPKSWTKRVFLDPNLNPIRCNEIEVLRFTLGWHLHKYGAVEYENLVVSKMKGFYHSIYLRQWVLHGSG